MSEKLKIISLGGLNEIGKNITVLEYGRDMIVVDCGMGFPEDDMYGIDSVIADTTYLVKNKNKLRGLFLTHGHEDHIGSIPYLLRDVNVPIYATRMTAGLVKLKLEEHRLLNKTKLITCEAGEVVKAPMPGTIMDVKVSVGAAVEKAQVVVVLEAMKMDNDITSPCDGKISFKTVVGNNVETNTVLAVIG